MATNLTPIFDALDAGIKDNDDFSDADKQRLINSLYKGLTIKFSTDTMFNLAQVRLFPVITAAEIITFINESTTLTTTQKNILLSEYQKNEWLILDNV